VLNKYKKRLFIVTLGIVCMLLLTSCSYVDLFKCSWKKSVVDDKLAQQLILPLSKLPEKWYSEYSSNDAIELKDVYIYANKIITREYSYDDQDQYSIGASHILALYGSEECAKQDMDQLIGAYPNKVEWAPLIFWKYKSTHADEYQFAAVFPYRYSGDPIGSYVVHIVVLARYGTVISVFFLNSQTTDITPDQVKEIVLALDEQFVKHEDLWRK
jgi:hypothetical protein